jgi:Ca2+-binding RTX toxin-like protein
MHRLYRRAGPALLPATLAAVVAVALVGSGGASGKTERLFAAKVQDQVLVVDGSSASSTIALRVAPGSPNEIEVDYGDDGSADRRFDQHRFARIEINAGAGDDTVRIDERNGVFTDTEPTIIHGGDGHDVLGARGIAPSAVRLILDGGDGNDLLIGGIHDDVLDGGLGDDLLIGLQGADRLACGAGNDRAVADEADTVARDC